jgi:hypothetical protein
MWLLFFFFLFSFYILTSSFQVHVPSSSPAPITPTTSSHLLLKSRRTHITHHLPTVTPKLIDLIIKSLRTDMQLMLVLLSLYWVIDSRINLKRVHHDMTNLVKMSNFSILIWHPIKISM